MKVINSKKTIHVKTIFSEPTLSSIFPRDKQPIIPNKFIKIPSFSISFSENPNKKDAIILAKAKIHITALLKKKLTYKKFIYRINLNVFKKGRKINNFENFIFIIVYMF